MPTWCGKFIIVGRDNEYATALSGGFFVVSNERKVSWFAHRRYSRSANSQVGSNCAHDNSW
jgi:hypothetical protein